MKLLSVAIAWFTLALTGIPDARAIAGQPGTLDGFFATGSALGPGKAITPIGVGNDQANAMVLQPDGMLVVAGYCINGSVNNFCALRYKSDGTPDTSFGVSGTGAVITSVGSGSSYANAIALQPDGKIVAVGFCDNSGGNFDFCAARYLPNGTLDASFGSAGTVITAVGTASDVATAVIVQPDGKLVLTGYCAGATTYEFCALRYNDNGTPDTGFGGSGTGKVITNVGSGEDTATSAALQPDGKLVLAGSCINSGDFFCALRYNANGTLDTTFGGSGTGKVIATAISGSGDYATAMALQPDGKLVLAGHCFAGAGYDFCALRYNANGTPDLTFGGTGTGKFLTSVGIGADRVNALVLQPDGKLVLAGYCGNGPNTDFCAARYHGNGTLDTTFGPGATGKVITAVGSGDDVVLAMTLQPDGKLVLAGYCSNGANTDFCALRYDGGPFGYKACTPDLDGDGHTVATVDGLIYMRVMLGLTGNAVVGGITFPPTATRNSWPLIRDYLVTQCGVSLVQ